jgi:hypothetical protein
MMSAMLFFMEFVEMAQEFTICEGMKQQWDA